MRASAKSSYELRRHRPAVARRPIRYCNIDNTAPTCFLQYRQMDLAETEIKRQMDLADADTKLQATENRISVVELLIKRQKSFLF